MTEREDARWLVLIHQIPPKPNYLRVKIGRRLQRLGAVAIKNSVYVLPRTESCFEDFQWVVREIAADGGESSLCEARFVDGLDDEQVESLFNVARDADCAQMIEEARALSESLRAAGSVPDEKRVEVEGRLARLKRRLAGVASIDFFGAPGRDAAEHILAALDARLQARATPVPISETQTEVDRGRTWVTRTGIHVDRMASGWLIRRFIDKDACFKFVARDYRPEPGELRFDMFEAEYTHEGDLCTFEVLLKRFRLEDPGLRPIAEIVHDIDLKDGKFSRQDALGFELLVAGIAMAHKEDEVRLERACAVLDDLYEYYRRKH